MQSDGTAGVGDVILAHIMSTVALPSRRHIDFRGGSRPPALDAAFRDAQAVKIAEPSKRTGSKPEADNSAK